MSYSFGRILSDFSLRYQLTQALVGSGREVEKETLFFARVWRRSIRLVSFEVL